MAARMERYPSGPIERYPSDLLVAVEADDVLMREDSMLIREESMESLYREFFLDSSLQRFTSLDSLDRNDSINPDMMFANGFPEGGNYVLTHDARAFADPSVGDIAISNVIVSEMVPEDDQAPVMQLDDGDFAKDAVAPVAIMEEVHGVHIESGDLSDTHFAGTNGVNEADPMLDSLVSDTISTVPTFEHSHDAVVHLEKAGIIPKVVDRFTPTTTVRVIYENNLEIQNGMNVMASDMSKPPMVEIEGAFVMPGTLYTIMFVAYNEQNGERLHWLHVNYQAPQSIASAVARAGADVVHYKVPQAANMAFVLFRQRQRLTAPVAHAQDEVSARGFTAEHHLTPVGALCFEAV